MMRRITDQASAWALDGADTEGACHGQPAPAPLHVCPGCGSHLVQPTSWQREDGLAGWRVWRRCPDCDWVGDGVHREAEIDVFDEQLGRGTQKLAGELAALEHANMVEMAAAFTVALIADLIGPDDFG